MKNEAVGNGAASGATGGPVKTTDDQGGSIRHFVGANAAYYERQFDLIGNRSGFTWSFNLAAALLGADLVRHARIMEVGSALHGSGGVLSGPDRPGPVG